MKDYRNIIYIKNNGKAVLGKGIAKEANERYQLDGILANCLKTSGNHVYALKKQDGILLISYPTKTHW